MSLKRALTVGLSVSLLMFTLAACGPKTEGSSSSQPDESEPAISTLAPADQSQLGPEPAPVWPYTNPLTGEGLETDISQNRPIAIMLNNLKKALPQAGVSQADIIYEMPAEGGITRMLGVFQSVEDVGEIGTVRSARDYYVSMALGHDAVFLHAGGSPQAYVAIKNWGVTALDCVNGPYEGTLFWRDKTRRKNAGLEHSVLTSGAKILELLPTYSKVTMEHKDSFSYPIAFLGDGETATGETANILSVKFSSYKTGVFTYDQETGLYLVEQYGDAYVDANSGEQVAVKNVLVLRTDVADIKGDTAGRKTVRTTGTGDGQFCCDGKVQEITWSRKDEKSPMTYQTKDGQELKLGVGVSYVNVIASKANVTVE